MNYGRFSIWIITRKDTSSLLLYINNDNSLIDLVIILLIGKILRTMIKKMKNQDVVDMIVKDSSGKFPSLVNFSVGLFGLVECIDWYKC